MNRSRLANPDIALLPPQSIHALLLQALRECHREWDRLSEPTEKSVLGFFVINQGSLGDGTYENIKQFFVQTLAPLIC